MTVLRARVRVRRHSLPNWVFQILVEHRSVPRAHVSVHPPFGSWAAGSGTAAVYIPFVPLDPFKLPPTPKIYTHTHKLTCSAVGEFNTPVMSRATQPKLSTLDSKMTPPLSNFTATSSLPVSSDEGRRWRLRSDATSKAVAYQILTDPNSPWYS